MVIQILPFANSPQQREELTKRLPSLLGYWLYDSLLRFPGLLVNATAAASYLDIAIKQFNQSPVRKVFSKALYRGPFNDPNDPHWWRTELDELIRKAKVQSGNELASKAINRDLGHCLDSETRRRAGWYCMVKKVPVSEDNSVGNISWFPPGADLARIRKDVYEQMGPWLGLY
jgi:hypothetical protein